jgi:hypothetical protein
VAHRGTIRGQPVVGRVDLDVADVACGAVGPAVDRAVSDDPGADTRGDLDHHERIAVGELAVMFAQRHRVGIVVDQGGAVESGCEPRPDREPVPARHDRPADHGRACEIHWAWHREADDRRNVATVPPEQQCRRLTGDLQAFFGALVDIGYRGPLTFESFSSAVVAPGLSNEAIWRNLWDDGADLASHARGFIDDGLRAGWQRHAS